MKTSGIMAVAVSTLFVKEASLLPSVAATATTIATAKAAPPTTAPGVIDAAAAAAPTKTPTTSDDLANFDENDYSHFAELLATVMVFREGGVDAAFEAVPVLHDMAHAMIVSLSSIAEAEELEQQQRQWGDRLAATANNSSSSAFDVTSWPGLSASQAAKLASNYYSSNSSSAIISAKYNEFSNHFNDKINRTDQLLFFKGERLGAKLNATFESKKRNDASDSAASSPLYQGLKAVGDALRGGETQSETDNAAATTKSKNDAFIDIVNSKLSDFRIELQNKGKIVQEPSKYANAAAAIQKSITGVALSLRGVNFAPCLISASVRGASVGATGVVRGEEFFEFRVLVLVSSPSRRF